jgi:hypothetical protein
MTNLKNPPFKIFIISSEKGKLHSAFEQLSFRNQQISNSAVRLFGVYVPNMKLILSNIFVFSTKKLHPRFTVWHFDFSCLGFCERFLSRTPKTCYFLLPFVLFVVAWHVIILKFLVSPIIFNEVPNQRS